VVAPTVPFLYQTSPRPFNEEVDFFNFLAKLGYRVLVPGRLPGTRYLVQGQVKKMKREPALMEGGTDNESAGGTGTNNNHAGGTGGAGGTCTNNDGAGGQALATVPELMTLEVLLLTTLAVWAPVAAMEVCLHCGWQWLLAAGNDNIDEGIGLLVAEV